MQTFQGLPGSNSGTKSVNDEVSVTLGQSCFEESFDESGQPSPMPPLTEDHVLEIIKKIYKI